jgi:hypothetical protein
MQVLEPEYALEVVDVEVRIDLPEFRCLLVDFEHALPFGIRRRRDRSHYRAPLGHRQARSGQPGHAAEYDHGEYHRATDE